MEHEAMAPEFGKPLRQLPLIPAAILKKHRVHEPLDTRFRAAARLLQALWREDRGIPIGSYAGEDGKRRKLGSRMTEKAGLSGSNFLNADIAHFVWREVAYREMGAMIDQNRLATNLLSSMPLTFNLLAPVALNRDFADTLLYALLKDFRGLTEEMLFEHSPGRGDPQFTGDYSAFDALVRYTRPDGKKGFVAFEIKYSEAMREPAPELKSRYAELAGASRLFVDPAEPALRANPLQQLWREHLLAQSMIDGGLYAEGYFVVIAPTLNYHVQDAVETYRAQLRQPEESKIRFIDMTLEQVIKAIGQSDKAHADSLYRRYCDFWLVDGELELNAPGFTTKGKSKILPLTASGKERQTQPIELRPKRRVGEKGLKSPPTD
jgi:hypothetical protein